MSVKNNCSNVLPELKSWKHANLFKLPDKPLTSSINFNIGISVDYNLSVCYNLFDDDEIYIDTALKDSKSNQIVYDPKLGYENNHQFKSIEELQNELLRLHNLCHKKT